MENSKFYKTEIIKRGLKKKYTTPKKLWDAAVKYFEWCDQNPLIEQKAFCSQGEIHVAELEKQRPYTINAMCIFIGISAKTFATYEKEETFSEVCEMIRETIYENKFSGAASGTMNATIISRELGLRDNVDHTTGGKEMKSGGTVVVTKGDVESVLDMI